nr:hypothetical protein BaRGS_018785 [Batillaria attramentaria]
MHDKVEASPSKDVKPEKQEKGKEAAKDKPKEKEKGKEGKEGKDKKDKDKDKDKGKEKTIAEEQVIPDKPEVVVFAMFGNTAKYPMKVSVLGEMANVLLTVEPEPPKDIQCLEISSPFVNYKVSPVPIPTET